LLKRCSSRFQSNHHRGYFWRKRISSSGAKNSRPPAPATTISPRSGVDHCQVPPLTAPSTMRIGTATKMRNSVVRRFSGLSG
jgi:hypothetical protein